MSVRLLLPMLVACTTTPEDTGAPPSSVAAGTPFEQGEGTPVDAFEHPDVALPPPARQTTRLSVDELDASIQVVAGSWNNGAPINWSYFWTPMLRYDVIGKTLGKTDDFGQVTAESREITPLYVKYMDDMASHVCQTIGWADEDKQQEDRTLLRFVDDPTTATDGDINANLRYLLLRFHGEYVAPTDTDSLVEIRAVYDTVLAASDAVTAWDAVCNALLLSPAFHAY